MDVKPLLDLIDKLGFQGTLVLLLLYLQHKERAQRAKNDERIAAELARIGTFMGVLVTQKAEAADDTR